jgi:hypothetical protein
VQTYTAASASGGWSARKVRDARATGPRIATDGATAFLVIMAMVFGLILPRMLFECVLPVPA